MKQYRWLLALVVGAFLLAACGGMQAAVPEGSVQVSSEARDLVFLQTDFYTKTAQELADGSYVNYYTEVEDGEFVECPGVPEDQVGWHFVHPAGNFVTASIGFNGEDAFTLVYPGDEASVQVAAGRVTGLYFATDPGARLISATATGIGGNDFFVLSHVCVADGKITIPSFVTVEKTAETSFKRTYKWDIEKTGPAETQLLYYPDGTVDLNYYVTVGLDEDHPYLDSDFTVSGIITITNNSLDPNLVVSIDDVRDNLGLMDFEDIEVYCGIDFAEGSYLLEPGAENALVCTYSVTDDALKGESGTNFVYVDVSAVDLVSATIFDFDDWDFADAEIDEKDTCVDVYDTNLVDAENLDGFLGTVCIEGEEVEGAETAPHTFPYTLTLSYTDFEECGLVRIDNTAMFVTRDTETEGSDDWDVWINVQCAEGETAWAANGDVPLELRYTNRGNWATYVDYYAERELDEDASFTTTLFAGQTIPVGNVTFSGVVDGKVTITVVLTDEDAAFEDVAENLKVQDYETAPSGNPEVGLFEHKKTCDFEASECSIEVPVNNFYGVHVNVVNLFFVEE